MALYQANECGPSPGCAEDLFDLLDEIDDKDDKFSTSLLLGDTAFSLDSDEFSTFLSHIEYLNDEYPFARIGRFDYHAGLLYFKAMTPIHSDMGNLFQEALCSAKTKVDALRQANFIPHIKGLGTLVSMHNEDTGEAYLRMPDAGAVDLDRNPVLVVEISYAHRFTRSGLKDRYQSYLTQSEGKVKIVVCVDIYYGRGKERVLQTAEHLDRSAIAIWASDKHGEIQNLMDWTPLS